jgi:cytochrome P450
MWDVMAGGIDTTSTTLEWLFYILCNYPETQRKIQEELDKVVGPNRLPKYEDKDNLPYINAVILELMRWKHFAPFGLPHMTLEDTEVGGYSIPPGTQVLVNFHASGMDAAAWKSPEQWRPERWLEEEKALKGAFMDGEIRPTKESNKFIPFGIGQRMCVGWGLGRVVLWTKVATHCHCFNFTSASGKEMNMAETFGVTIVPEEQKVKFTPRPAAKLLRCCEDTFPKNL